MYLTGLVCACCCIVSVLVPCERVWPAVNLVLFRVVLSPFRPAARRRRRSCARARDRPVCRLLWCREWFRLPGSEFHVRAPATVRALRRARVPFAAAATAAGGIHGDTRTCRCAARPAPPGAPRV